MFRVSYKSVLYRVSEKAGKQIWYQFNREYSQRFNQTLLKADEPNPLKKTEAWRSSPEGSRAGEPDNLSPSDFKEDRLWCLVRRAYEQDLISLPKAAEILNIPLDEMRSHVQPSWV
jgi:hypothetical protein